MKRVLLPIIAVGIIFGVVLAYFFLRRPGSTGARDTQVRNWILNPSAHPEWVVEAGDRCGDAPFRIPSTGFIGYLWDDSFRVGHRHQGIDLFAGTDSGVTPVYSVYDGYLTRQSDWKSTIIIRIPSDPLHPGRQIWTYYTHMASSSGVSTISPDFPPGTSEVFVPAGTLLGFQGNYSGDSASPVGVHLHFSIVQDDGSGGYRNELDINNTDDPSPYFGLNLNANTNSGEVPVCASGETP